MKGRIVVRKAEQIAAMSAMVRHIRLVLGAAVVTEVLSLVVSIGLAGKPRAAWAEAVDARSDPTWRGMWDDGSDG